MYLQKVKERKKEKLTTKVFVGILKVTDEKSRIRIRNQVYGSKDNAPYQNVTDLEHCLLSCFNSDPFPFRLCSFFRKRGGSADSNDEDNTDREGEEEEKDTEPELTDKEESGGEDPEPAAKRRAALRIQDEDSDHTQELFPDDL
jgi:hypothetical protein